MKTIKKITSLVIMLTVFAVAAGQTFAAFDAINDTTGPGSINNVSATETNINNWGSTNDADFIDTKIGVGNTGGETTDYNTGAGSTDTGNTNVAVDSANNIGISVNPYTNSWDGDFTASNDTTGPNSGNTANVSLVNDIDVVNTSTSLVDNLNVGIGNTGFNSAGYNTGEGEVKTGEALVSASGTNMVNLNYTAIALELDDIDVDALNDTTGPGSTNTSVATVNNDLDVTNRNYQADVYNTIIAVSNTGFNAADYNTGKGSVDAGDAEADAEIINGVNYNETVITIDMADAEIDALNDTTGPGLTSTNTSIARVTNDVDVLNRNYAYVDNLGVAVANTGINSTSYNTGAGEVTTGEANADTVIDNEVNVNLTDVEIDMGDAEISASNDTTGPNSGNTAIATVVNDVDVTNRNDAKVYNDGVSISNTGFNSADYNTGAGTVDSGDAEATTTVTNDVNVNDTKISVSSSDVTTSNDTTGPGSTNTAIASETNTVDVTNNNTAIVDNTVVTVSNTGGNSADFNTGDGSSTTGDATVTIGSSNTVNHNTTDVSGH